MLCPLPQTALTSLSVNPSCALPGDALNSVVDTSFSDNTKALSIKEPSSVSYLKLLQNKQYFKRFSQWLGIFLSVL